VKSLSSAKCEIGPVIAPSVRRCGLLRRRIVTNRGVKWAATLGNAVRNPDRRRPAYRLLPCLVLASCGQSDESRNTDPRSCLALLPNEIARAAGSTPIAVHTPAPTHVRQAMSATLHAGEARNGDERRRLRSRKEAGA
jgi:hypothetical protein